MCTNPLKIKVKDEEYTVKCGKCPTCRREKSQEWAIKLINEAKYHKKASFITLTFDSKILCDKNSKGYKYGARPGFAYNIENSKEYFQKFIKRLRKKFKNKTLTYFHVGEYGEKTHRPHHHMILFGENFENDRKEMEISKSGKIQYHSDTLFELWCAGRISIQDLNENNTIYICQYSLKKFKKDDKYKTIFSFSNRSKMSQKWGRRNHKEIRKGFLTSNDGKKFRVPKSYIESLKKEELGSPMQESVEIYENLILDRIMDTPNSELLERQKKREEAWKCRNLNINKSRDF